MKLTPEIIEELVYHRTLMEGDDYRYDDADPKTYEFTVDWQCTVSIANWVAVHRLYGFDDPPMHCRGSYSPDSISFEENEDLPEALIGALLGLEDYPLIDNEIHAEVEWDIIETDVVECIDTFVYGDTIQALLEKYEMLEDAFKGWFEDCWSEHVSFVTECIENASFHIEFEEALGEEELENIFKDFLAAEEAKGLAQQGFQQHAFFQKKQS